MLATKLQDAKREEGFTLIELLVVVIIIGILAAIAIPTFLNQRERAWERAADSDVRNAAIEIESFFNDDFEYPTNLAALTALEIQTSDQVVLNYAPFASSAGGALDAYWITACHAQVDTCGTTAAPAAAGLTVTSNAAVVPADISAATGMTSVFVSNDGGLQ